MKRLLFVIVGILVSISIVFTGCGGTEQPPSSSGSFANTPDELEVMIGGSMTLDQVYTLMTQELKNNSILYPAQDIYRQTDGKWHFTAKEGGSPGDRDAPFQVLVFIPSPIGDPHYMIFFDNKNVFHDAWFEYDAATSIQKLLWTTETSD